MLLTYKTLVELIFRSLWKNFIRSSTIVITAIIVISSSIALVGWIEVSPQMVVEKSLSERGYEIQVSQIFYHQDNFPRLATYLETEPLIESSSIIHKSMFLYNLNNRSPAFNVLNPQDQFDFFISQDFTNFIDGVYLVSSEYLSNLIPTLNFETGSSVTFGESNNGIIISRRILNIIEQNCADTYSIGDEINFSIALSHLPAGQSSLFNLNPQAFSNMVINGIYDRTPTGSNPIDLSFYQESLGDGVFVSNSLLSSENISLMETNGFFPRMFVKIDQNEIAKLSLSRVIPEIENIASRISEQGFFSVRTQNTEVEAIIEYFEHSQIVVMFLLLPLVIISEILFLVLIRRLINDDTIEKMKYLHLRGNSDDQILFVEFGEFLVLNLIGLIGGTIGGFISIDILLTTNKFFDFNSLLDSIGSGFQIVLESGATIFILGILLIILMNLTFYYRRFTTVIASLQKVESIEPSDRIFTRIMLNKNSLLLILGCIITFIAFQTIIPMIMQTLGFTDISLELIPLFLIILIVFWILISFFSPQYLLQIFQTFLESINIFKHPKRKLTWLSLFRRKAQYLSLMALLALTVSLASFSFVYYQSLQENSIKNTNYLLGADLKVITDSVDNSFANQIEGIEGVSTCIGFTQFQILTPAGYVFTLIGIDPVVYFEHFPIAQESIVRGPAAENLSQIFINYNIYTTIIINSEIAEVFQWVIGTNIDTFGFPGQTANYRFTVKAIIDSAPGIGSLYFGDKEDSGGFAIVHEDLLESFDINEASSFLVLLDHDITSVEPVINQIKTLSPVVRSVLTSEYYQESNQAFLQLAGVQGILTLNCIGALLISLIGISTMYQSLLEERMTEFAVFRTLGATKGKITRLMISESSILSIISITVGMISGVLFGMGFLIISREVTVPPHNAFALELIIPFHLLFLSMCLIGGIVLFVNFVYVRKISRLQINTILKGE